MTIDNAFDEIINFMESNADPEIVAKYKRYFTSGYDAYGLQQGILFSAIKEWTTKFSNFTLQDYCLLGEKLFATGKYEAGSAAILFLLEHKKQLDLSHVDIVGNWLEKYVTNWAHCDYICSEFMKPLQKKKIIDYKYLASWLNSEGIYKRRAVPVSYINFVKETKLPEDLMESIRPIMHDPEKPVRQGIGWFLREAWKLNPEPVEKFLLEYKDSSPRLIFQYATEKMSKEQKERFRAEKKKKN